MKTKNLLICLALIGLTAKSNAQIFTPSTTYSMFVLNSFKQYDNFNCATIAVIKCGMATFGADQVAQIDSSGDPIKVILRNHQQILITLPELKAATDSARMRAAKSAALYNEATILYAAMAKMAVQLSADPRFSYCTDYTKALYFLDGRVNHGVSSEDIPTLLGLKPTPQTQRGTGLNYVGHNQFHAVYATYNMFDNFGYSKRFTDINFLSHFSLIHLGGSLHFGYFRLADL